MITLYQDENEKRRRKGYQAINPMVFGKVPPQAPDFEEAVLGALLLESHVLPVVLGILPTEDYFYVDAHQKIYAAIKRLFTKHASIDLLTVTDELRRADELEIVGGLYYLTRLTMGVVSSGHIERHAQMIQEKHILRSVITMCGTGMQAAYENSTDLKVLLDGLESTLFKLSGNSIQRPYMHAPELAKLVKDTLIDKMKNPNVVAGVPTGFKALDRIINGAKPGDLIILAARPSVGKTAFALNVTYNAASSKIKPTGVGFFSLEMSRLSLMQRMMASISHVFLDNIQRGNMEHWQQQAFDDANDQFARLNIKIDDSPGINIYELRTKARRMKEKDGVGLIIIDYLQLMQGLEDSKTSNREQEISKISRDLKALAKELEIPIIALSQLNRSVETRGGKGGPQKPQLSDLRESGAIEQDADVVIFLTRPDYQKTDDETDPSIKDSADIHIAKNREGAIDDIALKMVKSIQKWFDLDEYRSYSNDNTFGDPRAIRQDVNPFAGMPTNNPVDFSIPKNQQNWTGSDEETQSGEKLPF